VKPDGKTDRRRETVIKNIPNTLTALRLALAPVFVLLMIEPSRTMVYVATGIFILGALTDFMDGVIARRYGAVSDAGKLLDPVADKVLVMAALVMLLAQRSEVDGAPWVPAWMVVLVLAREIWVTGLRGVAASRGVVVAASAAGKLKSAVQMVAIVFLLLHDYPVAIFGSAVPSQILGLNALLLSIVVSYWGAIDYTLAVFSGRDVEPRGG
jgi:CDP-diacylglycerol--glycerol-3-phosphate 3-phosphatidyltransferase